MPRGVRPEGGTRWCQSQALPPPQCAGMGVGDVNSPVSWLEDKEIM